MSIEGGRALLLTLVLAPSLACAEGSSTPVPEVAADSIVLFEMDSGTAGYRDVAAGQLGGVWALGETPPFVQRFTAEGRIAQRFGRQGQGPGELRNPMYLIPTGDEQRPIRIYEPPARALVGFTADGREADRHPVALATAPVVNVLRQLSYGRARRVLAAGEQIYVWDQPEGATSTDDLRRSVLVRLSSTGALIDTLADLRPTEPKIESITTSAYLGPIPLVAPCADGSVLLFQPSRGRLERFGGDGRVLFSDSLSIPRRPLGPYDVRPFLEMFLEWELRRTQQTIAAAERTRMIDQLLARGSEMFSPIAPFAVSMMCDTEGRAWLQEFSTADHPVGYGRRWRLYDRGTLTAVIAFPAGFQPYLITTSDVVGVYSDELDRQRVARVLLKVVRIPPR